MIVYHVVTDRPMNVGQKIIFDVNNHSGVYQRVVDKIDIVNEIYKKEITRTNHRKIVVGFLLPNLQRQGRKEQLKIEYSIITMAMALNRLIAYFIAQIHDNKRKEKDK